LTYLSAELIKSSNKTPSRKSEYFEESVRTEELIIPPKAIKISIITKTIIDI
tara:strand:- start:621 stop:776 length:156 start_codon:yes stop_codon:yes gene_type:complete